MRRRMRRTGAVEVVVGGYGAVGRLVLDFLMF
jgi:hypothetical protein